MMQKEKCDSKEVNQNGSPNQLGYSRDPFGPVYKKMCEKTAVSTALPLYIVVNLTNKKHQDAR